MVGKPPDVFSSIFILYHHSPYGILPVQGKDICSHGGAAYEKCRKINMFYNGIAFA
jgi:hypothetical protein